MLPTFGKIIRQSIVSIILVFPVVAFAQKLEKPSIDKIYGDTTFYTSQKTITSTGDLISLSAGIGANARRTGNQIYLDIQFEVLGKDGRFTVPDSSVAIIKLANNTLINLFNVNSQKAEYKKIDMISSSQPYWSARLSYAISREDIQRILNSTITVFRMTTKKQIFDFDIKPKNSAVMQKMFKLVINAR